MRKFPLLFLAILGCVVRGGELPAVGRFGETMEQCKLRYGPPVREWGAVATFEKNGFALSVTFHEGRAEIIRYQKIDGSPITKAEVDALLANISAGPWKPSELFRVDWVSPEGHRATHRNFVNYDLSVESADFVRRVAEKKAAAEASGVQGAKGL